MISSKLTLVESYSSKKHCIPRAYNRKITRKDVANSYLYDKLDESFISAHGHNSSKMSVYKDHLDIYYNSMGNYKDQLRDKNQEIKTLSKTIKELKSRSLSLDGKANNPYNGLLNLKNKKAKLFIPLPVSEREKFNNLLKRVTKLELEN